MRPQSTPRRRIPIPVAAARSTSTSGSLQKRSLCSGMATFCHPTTCTPALGMGPRRQGDGEDRGTQKARHCPQQLHAEAATVHRPRNEGHWRQAQLAVSSTRQGPSCGTEQADVPGVIRRASSGGQSPASCHADRPPRAQAQWPGQREKAGTPLQVRAIQGAQFSTTVCPCTPAFPCTSAFPFSPVGSSSTLAGMQPPGEAPSLWQELGCWGSPGRGVA